MAIKLVLYYLTTLAIGLTWYATEASHTEIQLPTQSHRLLEDNQILHRDPKSGKWGLIISNPSFQSRDVKFYLLTPSIPDPSKKIELTLTPEKTLTSADANKFFTHFQTNLPTRIVIHGWSTTDHVLERFAEAYFVKPKGANGGKFNHKVNLIYVDWSKGANPLNYAEARKNVEIAGNQVADLILFLNSNGFPVMVDSLTMIAFSNGCHVMGVAGKRFQKVQKEKGSAPEIVPKMIALAPDLIAFQSNKIKQRLAKTDAAYVVVIVTCGGLLVIFEPLGHATYYPNGGRKQPGCAPDDFICDQTRALDYYIESINHPDFNAIECDDLRQLELNKCTLNSKHPEHQVKMGGEPGHTSKNVPHGVYYLETGSKSPFSHVPQPTLAARFARAVKDSVLDPAAGLDVVPGLAFPIG